MLIFLSFENAVSFIKKKKIHAVFLSKGNTEEKESLEYNVRFFFNTKLKGGFL